MRATADPRRRGTLPCLVKIACLFFAVVGGAQAQTITGSLTPYSHPQYAAIDSHFLVTGAQIDGQTAYNGSMVIICTDIAAISIDEDPVTYPVTLDGSYPPLTAGVADQLDVWDRYAPRDEALATAQAMWLIDSYYVDYFTSPPGAETSARQYAFQNALWEIFGDGGTGSPLDYSSGNINRSKFAPSGGSSAPELWTHMNILIDAVNNSGVTADYDPTLEWYTALDARSGYQDYLALSLDASLMHAPEPTSGMLAVLSGALLLGRRRRR